MALDDGEDEEEEEEEAGRGDAAAVTGGKEEKGGAGGEKESGKARAAGARKRGCKVEAKAFQLLEFLVRDWPEIENLDEEFMEK